MVRLILAFHPDVDEQNLCRSHVYVQNWGSGTVVSRTAGALRHCREMLLSFSQEPLVQTTSHLILHSLGSSAIQMNGCREN